MQRCSKLFETGVLPTAGVWATELGSPKPSGSTPSPFGDSPCPGGELAWLCDELLTKASGGR